VKTGHREIATLHAVTNSCRRVRKRQSPEIEIRESAEGRSAWPAGRHWLKSVAPLACVASRAHVCRSASLEAVGNFEADTIELDMSGAKLRRIPLRVNSAGVLLFSLKYDDIAHVENYRCRMTVRQTLLCVAGTGASAEYLKFKHMPVRGAQRQLYPVDVP
jgi:hypothetical protein